MIRQQYYTSARRTVGGSAGFGIKAQTVGIEPAVAQVLEQYSRYHTPHSLSPDDVESMPVSLSFYNLGEGLWAITHCKYVGLDHTGTRWGNFFAHSLLCDEESLRAIDFAPISLLDSNVWVAEDTSDQTDLPILAEPLPSAPLRLEETAVFINETPWRRQRLAELIQATIDYPQTGRGIVIVDEFPAMVEWLRALTLALPAALRGNISFTTYHRDPGAMDFMVTCTTADGDFRFTDADYRFQFCIFNYLEGRFSEGIVPSRAADVLAEAILRCDGSVLAEVNRYSEILKSTELSQLDGIVALAELADTPPDKRSREILMSACNLLSSSTPLAGGFAWEAARNLTREAMDCNCIDHLEILVPTYHALCDRESIGLLQEDCGSYLTRFLPTGSAEAVIELFAARLNAIPEVAEVLTCHTAASDWVSFLDDADPSEELAEACGQFVFRAGREALIVGDLGLWRALGRWAARHYSDLDLRTAQAVMAQRDLPISKHRALLDTLGGRSDDSAFALWLELSADVVLRNLREGASGWDDDLLRCTDALLILHDPERHISTLLDRLRDFPAVSIVALSSVLEVRTDLVEEIARAFGDASIPVDLLMDNVVQAPSLQPLLANLLEQNTEPFVLAQQLHQIALRRWPASKCSVQEHLIDQGLSRALALLQSPEQFDAFIEAAPSLREREAACGKLLIGKVMLSPGITLLTDHREIRALNGALKGRLGAEATAVSEEDIDRAWASLYASAALGNLSERASWAKGLRILKQIQAVRVSPETYDSYIRLVSAGLTKRLPGLSAEDLLEALEAIFVRSLSNQFMVTSADVLKQYVSKRSLGDHAVERIIEFLLVNAKFDAASGKAGAQLLRLLPKAALEELDDHYSQSLRKGTQAERWWRQACEDVSRGLLSRFLRR